MKNSHHVVFAVNDIAEAAAWYAKYFGCGIHYQGASCARIRFGDSSLALMRLDQGSSQDVAARQSRRVDTLATASGATRPAYVWNLADQHLTAGAYCRIEDRP